MYSISEAGVGVRGHIHRAPNGISINGDPQDNADKALEKQMRTIKKSVAVTPIHHHATGQDCMTKEVS